MDAGLGWIENATRLDWQGIFRDCIFIVAIAARIFWVNVVLGMSYVS